MLPIYSTEVIIGIVWWLFIMILNKQGNWKRNMKTKTIKPFLIGTVQIRYFFSNLQRSKRKSSINSEETFQNTTIRASNALKRKKKNSIIVMLETYLKFDPRAFWIAFLTDSESARQFTPLGWSESEPALFQTLFSNRYAVFLRSRTL